MKVKETYIYRIPTWCTSAIVNDDYSHLDQEDTESINRFLNNLPEPKGTWSFEEEPFYSRDNNIDRIGAEVVRAVYTVFESISN